jgi:hypothetical protein
MDRHTSADEIARLRRRLTGQRRRATTVALAPYVRTVDAALACGTRPGRRYWGDCFRRAADYVLARVGRDGPCPPPGGMTLVHGTGRAGLLLWAHAWVELPGPPGSGGPAGALVFCGVRQRFYDREGYARVLGTKAEATYRPEEVVARLRATRRYGPWHRGALGGAPARRLDPDDAPDAPPRRAGWPPAARWRPDRDDGTS